VLINTEQAAEGDTNTAATTTATAAAATAATPGAVPPTTGTATADDTRAPLASDLIGDSTVCTTLSVTSTCTCATLTHSLLSYCTRTA
jgi:hypothetical protein